MKVISESNPVVSPAATNVENASTYIEVYLIGFVIVLYLFLAVGHTCSSIRLLARFVTAICVGDPEHPQLRA